MIELALYICLIVLVVLVPALLVARLLEWREQDVDRRVARLRVRRTESPNPVWEGYSYDGRTFYPGKPSSSGETDGC